MIERMSPIHDHGDPARVGHITDTPVMCSHGNGEKREIYAIAIIADDPSGQIVPRRKTRTVQPSNKAVWPCGWEVPLNYVQLDPPVHWPPIRRRLEQTLSAKHFTKAS